MSSVLHDTKVAGNTEQSRVRRHICAAVCKLYAIDLHEVGQRQMEPFDSKTLEVVRRLKWKVNMRPKWVYLFSEGSKEMRSLLGGKGASLAEMSRLGLPVPQGFIITTEACNAYFANDKHLLSEVWQQVKTAMRHIEAQTGKGFGSPDNPLVVSVRSGAAISMPGMLETILNVGLNAKTEEGLARLSQQPGFAYDSYRRLIQNFARIVYNVPNDRFQGVLAKQGWGEHSLAESSIHADIQHIHSVVDEFLEVFQTETGSAFPQGPYEQLRQSIVAVFNSWFGRRAVEYRAFHHIPDELGTAVIVQVMVFGNMDADSGTGVVFSRNPATGEKQFFGEYLLSAQGEDVVAGIHTPKDIAELAQDMPGAFRRLGEICGQLERLYRDMQDVEFTIEKGKLWILQTRSAARTPIATVKCVVDMANEGLISQSEAIQRVNPALVKQLLTPCFKETPQEGILARGKPSSPGVASGKVALDRSQAEMMAKEGISVILVREQTSPDDAPIMPLVSGVLTQHGGATSHAAVVARGLGKPCVVGCEALQIDLDKAVIRVGNMVIAQGDDISIDGTTGKVYMGARGLASTSLDEFQELKTLLTWADEIRRLRVFADANTPTEIEAARELGVEAIGLCRTERMFYDSAFLSVFRDALLSDSSTAKQRAFHQLQQLQREEFRAILRAAGGMPVTVRFLNAPLDCFLPLRDSILTELTELRLVHGWNEDIGRKEQLLQVIDAWRQASPSFGLRGVRLIAALPEIFSLQVQALFEGACDTTKENIAVHPQVLIPFVSHVGEVSNCLELVRESARAVMQKRGMEFAYRVGAVIELPRAAITAGEIASQVDFLCIDTDGLTQSVFGYAREDSNKFLPAYVTTGVLSANPFTTMDEAGIGWLVQLIVDRARSVCSDIEIGIYGNHSQNLTSIELYHQWGLDYVSCHPSYLLAVRLAAAQAANE